MNSRKNREDMRDITEYIDEYVEDNYGHTNWGYTSSYTEFEFNDNDYDFELNNTIVIWYNSLEEV
tara:strand:- start:175 stop:369 length:195 start_codon:yes stop_codon:yes gene_type:complete